MLKYLAASKLRSGVRNETLPYYWGYWCHSKIVLCLRMKISNHHWSWFYSNEEESQSGWGESWLKFTTTAIFVDGFWKERNLERRSLELANLLNFTTGSPNSVGGRWTLDLEENVWKLTKYVLNSMFWQKIKLKWLTLCFCSVIYCFLIFF